MLLFRCLFDLIPQRLPVRARNQDGLCLTTTFSHAKNRLLVPAVTSEFLWLLTGMFVLFLTTDIGLIDFNHIRNLNFPLEDARRIGCYRNHAVGCLTDNSLDRCGGDPLFRVVFDLISN